MARVVDWFGDWTGRLVRALPRADWPARDDPFWAAVFAACVRHGVAEADADEAIQRLAEDPPGYLGQVLPRFLAAVRANWSEQPDRSPTLDRADAEHLSRDCSECSGGGLTSRYVPVRRRGHAEPVTASVGFVCHLCPLGRWLAARQRQAGSDTAKIPDLAEHPRYQDCSLRFDPPMRQGEIACFDGLGVREVIRELGNTWADERREPSHAAGNG